MEKKYVLRNALLFMALMASPAFAAKGIALISATEQGSNVNGQVTLNETPTGLEMEVKVANVPPGKHGFHIHENGNCADQGKAAGGPLPGARRALVSGAP